MLVNINPITTVVVEDGQVYEKGPSRLADLSKLKTH